MKSVLLTLTILFSLSAAAQTTAGETMPSAIDLSAPSASASLAKDKSYGIGLILSFENGFAIVEGAVPGSPAAAAEAIAPHDRLLAVQTDGNLSGDWVSLEGATLGQIVATIRGPKDHRVALRLIRDTRVFEVALVRTFLSPKD